MGTTSKWKGYILAKGTKEITAMTILHKTYDTATDPANTTQWSNQDRALEFDVRSGLTDRRV